MIKSCRDKWTLSLLEGKRVARFQAFSQQAEKRLRILEAATTIEDLMLNPGNRFEALSGDRKGRYSIRINAQWRVCFEFRDGDAYEVEIVDYH
jgi:toxin HigB-1